MTNIDTKIPTLLQELSNNVIYDCHPTQVAFNRSPAKQRLVEIGPEVLPFVAQHIRNTFPELETSKASLETVDWDMFGVWTWLVSNIRDAYKLPSGPFASDMPLCEQDIGGLCEYCDRVHAELAS